MKVFRTAILITLIFLSQHLCGIGSSWAEDGRPAVRFGAVLPLSGGLAHLGSAYRDAILLALEDKTKTTAYRYEVLFEDDQGELRNTAAAAKKLLTIDRVDAIISMWSNQGKVVAPLAESAQRIHMACAWDKEVTAWNTTFNLSATPDYFMQQYVQWLITRGIKRLQVIELNDSGSIAAHNELEQRARTTGLQVVSRERFNSGDRDFRSLLLRARATPVDAIYLNAGSPELEILAKQARELHLTTPFTTIGCFDFTTDLSLFEGASYMTMSWPPDEFIERFRSRFKREVVYQLGNFYDMIAVLVQAFESGTTADTPPSSELALRHLKRLREFDGLLGRYTIDQDRAFQSAPTFFSIRDGRRVRN